MPEGNGLDKRTGVQVDGNNLLTVAFDTNQFNLAYCVFFAVLAQCGLEFRKRDGYLLDLHTRAPIACTLDWSTR